ncbi:hypothetical protein BJX96DRAFT_124817 [Aspergillus floccosus]
MKLSTLLLAVFAFATSGMAEKTCTPSFDYCASDLTKDKGFTEDDLKGVLKGTDLADEDINNVLFHCKNPGIVGHPKVCQGGCKSSGQEGSHGC